MKKAIKNPVTTEPEQLEDDYILRLDGNFLDFLMKKYEISQTKLSKLTGMSRPKISSLLKADYIEEKRASLIQEAIEKIRGESFDIDEERGLRNIFESQLNSNTLNDNEEIIKEIPKKAPETDKKNLTVNDLLFYDNQDLKSKVKTLEDKIESLRDENNNLKIEKLTLQSKIDNDQTAVTLSDGISNLANTFAPLIQAGAMKILGIQPPPQQQQQFTNGYNGNYNGNFDNNYQNTFNNEQ